MTGPSMKGDARPLPKRFYKEARVDAVTAPGGGSAYRILLDGRPLRTPAKAELQLATRPLAEAVAAEWQAQGTHVDPATMPLTRLANSTIDGVAARRAEVIEEIVRYAMNDLLYYRTDQPETLVRLQAEAWDPVLDWAQTQFAVPLATSVGITHVAQPKSLAVAVETWLAGRQAIELAALHVITTLTGSALMALAHAHARLDAAALWKAAHVDEDFQISHWGWDAEAEARRKVREADFLASTEVLELAKDPTS